MFTGDWISRACPRCASDETVQRIRANAAAFTCHACGHDWAVKRMPLDAEAAEIVKRSRQMRTEALFTQPAAESMDNQSARPDNAS